MHCIRKHLLSVTESNDDILIYTNLHFNCFLQLDKFFSNVKKYIIANSIQNIKDFKICHIPQVRSSNLPL